MKQDKRLNLLGLAQAAGKLVSGEGMVVEAIQSNTTQLVLCARDVSPRTQKKIQDKCTYYKVPLVMEFDTVMLSHALGKKRSLCAITDKGFANSFKKQSTMMKHIGDKTMRR